MPLDLVRYGLMKEQFHHDDSWIWRPSTEDSSRQWWQRNTKERRFCKWVCLIPMDSLKYLSLFIIFYHTFLDCKIAIWPFDGIPQACSQPRPALRGNPFVFEEPTQRRRKPLGLQRKPLCRSPTLPSDNQTWQWKLNYQWRIFRCSVWLPEGIKV